MDYYVMIVIVAIIVVLIFNPDIHGLLISAILFVGIFQWQLNHQKANANANANAKTKTVSHFINNEQKPQPQPEELVFPSASYCDGKYPGAVDDLPTGVRANQYNVAHQGADIDAGVIAQQLTRNDPVRPTVGAIRRKELIADKYLREELDDAEQQNWVGRTEY